MIHLLFNVSVVLNQCCDYDVEPTLYCEVDSLLHFEPMFH